MKIILVSFVLATSILFSGCETTGTKTASFVDKAQQVHDDDGDLIQGGITLSVRTIINFTQKNPEKRAQVLSELNSVSDKISRASKIASLTVGGTVTPSVLSELLKANDDYVDSVMQALVPLYSAGYRRAKFAEVDQVKFAKMTLDWVNLISTGIKDATAQ